MNSEYGFIDLDVNWAAYINGSIRHKFYYTELPPHIENYIQRFGFERSVEIVEEVNPRQILVRRNQEYKPLVVYYPSGAGGNFLINVLSLSSDLIMNRFPTIEHKCNYICNHYDEEVSSTWHDINIMFQISEYNSKLVFQRLHPEESTVKNLWNFWINTDKLLLFKNRLLFSNLRKWNIDNIRYIEKSDGSMRLQHIIEGIEVPEKYVKNIRTRLLRFLEKHNIDIVTYYNLNSKTKNQIKTIFNDYTSTANPKTNSQCRLGDKKQTYFWDCNWNLDRDEFIFNLENLYTGLELNGFNPDVISKCYDSWISAVKRCHTAVLIDDIIIH